VPLCNVLGSSASTSRLSRDLSSWESQPLIPKIFPRMAGRTGGSRAPLDLMSVLHEVFPFGPAQRTDVCPRPRPGSSVVSDCAQVHGARTADDGAGSGSCGQPGIRHARTTALSGGNRRQICRPQHSDSVRGTYTARGWRQRCRPAVGSHDSNSQPKINVHVDHHCFAGSMRSASKD
jgi:hypothetical protein